MRALLFTVFGVFVAAVAGISYLAFAPAPEQASDSLKLVIETGSIPSTRTADEADGGDSPTGSIAAANGAQSESADEPSLDEVIAARLQQAGETAPDSDTAEPASAEAEAEASTQAANDSADTAATTVSDPQPSESDTQNVTAANAEDGSGFDAPDTASAPEGTVSITQMLAAELNESDGGSAESGQETAAPETQEPSSTQDATTTAEAAPSDEASSEPEKTVGRLQQAPQDTETAPEASAAEQRAEPQATDGQTGETAIAALDPSVGQDAAADSQQAGTEIPTATQKQPAASEQQGDAGPGDALPTTLSATEAPALPRQRGDFQLRGRIALIIRGLGVETDLTERAIAQLPQQVAMAFVPYGDDLGSWTQRARQDRHDILLQIPLEPEGYPETDPGPHTLLTSLSIDENLEHLDWLLDRFEGMTGVTNYLGGKFASSPGSFAPMLMELKARDLLYVDDSKAANPTTRQLARQVSLAYSVADVVIDSKRESDAIAQKLSELEAQARENGSAIAVGHAHAATLTAIESWLNSLNDKGLALVPITELTTEPAPRVSQSTGG